MTTKITALEDLQPNDPRELTPAEAAIHGGEKHEVTLEEYERILAMKIAAGNVNPTKSK